MAGMNLQRTSYASSSPGLARQKLANDAHISSTETLPVTGTGHLNSKKEASVLGVLEEPIQPPEGGLRAWLTVAGSFAITTAVYGLSNSVGVIQPFWATHQLSAFKVEDIAWISGANIFLCLFLGVQVGPWFDRFGPRWLLLTGSVIYLSGLLGMGFLPEDAGVAGSIPAGKMDSSGTLFALLMLLWGVIMGTGAALCCTVALSVLAHWFEKRRGLAAGIVFVGSSIGGVIFPLVLKATLEPLGWAWSMRILALIVAVLLGFGNLLIRGRITGKKGYGAVNLGCFKQPSFVWTTVGCFSQFLVVRETCILCAH